MDRTRLWLVAAVIVAGLWSWSQYRGAAISLPGAGTEVAVVPAASLPGGYPAFLPDQAHPVLDAIARGGPFPHRQDGGVFQNRERLLPPQARGYYHEYTVATPGADDRGARRIVTGGDPPVEYFYTDDHYRSFRTFEVAR